MKSLIFGLFLVFAATAAASEPKTWVFGNSTYTHVNGVQVQTDALPMAHRTPHGHYYYGPPSCYHYPHDYYNRHYYYQPRPYYHYERPQPRYHFYYGY
jgi:hypothetical protein